MTRFIFHHEAGPQRIEEMLYVSSSFIIRFLMMTLLLGSSGIVPATERLQNYLHANTGRQTAKYRLAVKEPSAALNHRGRKEENKTSSSSKQPQSLQ